jgi:ubiquitin carboxyl-terminal hydrolase 34
LVAGEIITGYKCDSCKNTVDIEKRPAIKKLPNTLILHLNRLKFDFDLMRHVKLNDRIEFPTVLNM